MKYILAASILISTNAFAYIYAEKGDYELDSMSRQMQQQDIEQRLDAIESLAREREHDEWKQQMFESIRR